jgi:molybdopterin biosynthesis enzyme MoaB
MNILVPNALVSNRESNNEVKLPGPSIEEWLNTVLKKVVDEESIPDKIKMGKAN